MLPASECPFFVKLDRQNNVLKYVLYPIAIIFSPILMIFRLIVFSVLCVTFLLLCYLFDAGTHYPQNPSRFRYYLDTRLCWAYGFIVNIFVQQLFVWRRGHRDSKCRVFVINHTSLNDMMVTFQAAQGVAVMKAALAKVFLFRGFIQMSRSILVRRGDNDDAANDRLLQQNKSVTQQMQDFVNSQDYMPLGICPEGTIPAPGYVLRFRTSAFRLGHPVHPVCIKYHTVLPFSWTNQHWSYALFNQFANPFGFITVTFLKPMTRLPDEDFQGFADRVGQAMAKQLRYKYCEYVNTDWFAFKSGKGEYSEAWKRDFGWMGSLPDFCRKYNLNINKAIYSYQVKHIKPPKND